MADIRLVKLLLTTIFVIQALTLSGQNMPSGFLQKDDSANITGEDFYIFKKDSTFLASSYFGKNIYSSGNYLIIGDSLILYYLPMTEPSDFEILEIQEFNDLPIGVVATNLQLSIEMKFLKNDSVEIIPLNYNKYDSAIAADRSEIRIYDLNDSVTTNISLYSNKIGLALKNMGKIVIYRRKAYPLELSLNMFMNKSVSLKCTLYYSDGKYSKVPKTEKFLIEEISKNPLKIRPIGKKKAALITYQSTLTNHSHKGVD